MSRAGLSDLEGDRVLLSNEKAAKDVVKMQRWYSVVIDRTFFHLRENLYVIASNSKWV
jgi:hypothetical protein